VQEFDNWDEMVDYYTDFMAAGIDCILAQKCEYTPAGVASGPGEVAFEVDK